MGKPLIQRLPLKDEVLSSWLTRRLDQLGLERAVFDDALTKQYPEVAAALARDPDFPEGRLWRKAVAGLVAVPVEGLQGIGWPSSPWFLAPGCRRSACLLCLSEAPLVTAQYVHELWLQSWRTTCPVHQVPLVEVPAVGASWALLSGQSRRLHGALMRRPDREAARLIDGWRRVPAYLREVVFSAEVQIMEAWCEHFASERGGAAVSGSLLVWRDLLAFCASSWTTTASPPIAAQALPWMIGSSYFRCRNVLPCVGPAPSLQAFRTMIDPAVRRTCLVAVMDALYELSGKRIVGLKRQPSWGWFRVLPHLPDAAWAWLDDQARAWPAGWHPMVKRWRNIVRG